MTAFQHLSVLTSAVVAALRPMAGDVVVDCTVGGCGHAEALLAAAPCSVIAFDQDPEAFAHASDVARRWEGRLTVFHRPFSEVPAVLASLGIGQVAGLFADLGVSSHQFDVASRGFSLRRAGPVDMRMSQAGPSAADLIASLDVEGLADLLVRFGDVRRAHRIASVLKAGSPWPDTVAMAGAVARASGGRQGRVHPATTVFQALRIAVNGEIDELNSLLAAAPQLLKPGGRLGILTFHSLEDRAVKSTLMSGSVRALPRDPYGNPIGQPVWTDVGDVAPDDDDDNPRARSARLRFATRCA